MIQSKTNTVLIEDRIIKSFCSDLKELGAKIINYEQKEMMPLTDNENKYYEEQEKCHICQKKSFVMIKMKK